MENFLYIFINQLINGKLVLYFHNHLLLEYKELHSIFIYLEITKK